MHATNETVPPPQPVLMRLVVRSWEYRHPRAWMEVRLACGVFNLALGVLLLASGRWLGSLAWLGLIPLAGSALLFWTGSRLRRTAQSEPGGP